MKPDIFFAFDWPRFQSDNVGMTRENKWSYWTACCAYYYGSCVGLDDNDEYLRIVCECWLPSDWARTKGAIFNGEKFYLENGKWHQKRAKQEWERATHIMKVRSEAGKLGGAPKKQNESKPEANQKHSDSDSPPQPPTDPQKDVGRNESAPAGDWLEELKKNPAYAGIDVGREFLKMTAWCSVNRKQPSKRRFVNWLNRAEAPLGAPITPAGASLPSLRDVTAYAQEKWPTSQRSAKWAADFYGFWGRKEWRHNGKLIDWKEELTKQVAKWRANDEPGAS